MDAITLVAVVLLSVGGFLALVNWLTLFKTFRSGRFCSPVPPLGGVCLVAGALLLPSIRPYAWAGILLDYGGIAFLLAIPWLLGDIYRTSRFNLLEEYAGRQVNQMVRLSLYRKAIFVLRQDFERPPGEYGLVQVSTTGSWERHAGRLVLRRGQEQAVFERQREDTPETWRQAEGFASEEARPELSLARVELRLCFRKKG